MKQTEQQADEAFREHEKNLPEHPGFNRAS